MDWELINGITGIISTVCAVVGIGYFSTHKNDPDKAQSKNILNTEKLFSFLIACSGWTLCCLSYLWFFEPYGSYPHDDEYLNFFGIVLSFPALVVFLYGLDLLINGTKNRSEDESDEKT